MLQAPLDEHLARIGGHVILESLCLRDGMLSSHVLIRGT
jgi:hypothetical protein